MPVEIKELIIRAVVDESDKREHDAPKTWTGSSEKEALLEDCVKQVLRILRRSRER